MTVDAGIVDWLRTGAFYVTSIDNTFAAAWGTSAVETEIMSPLALAADAATEADRQQIFLEGPLVVEVHDVPGLRADLLARAVTLTCAQLGYDAGVNVFVIGIEEQRDMERTFLTVLRKQT